MPEPTREDWIRIEQEFAKRWNFPNCCGSLDGKHIMITSPAKSGTLYYNYKGHFSLNLSHPHPLQEAPQYLQHWAPVQVHPLIHFQHQSSPLPEVLILHYPELDRHFPC